MFSFFFFLKEKRRGSTAYTCNFVESMYAIAKAGLRSAQLLELDKVMHDWKT
jgi:hypothetical protein